MFEITIQNQYGERLSLTNTPDYTVYEIDGLGPGNATINTSTVATFDGTRFNSSRLEQKNLVISIAINEDVEQNRIRLYQYIKTKQPIRVYYQNQSRDVYIDGYVENMEIGFFEQKQSVQVSIICPDPFFKDVDEYITELSKIIPLFTFPFGIEEKGVPFSELRPGIIKSIINEGDVESGVIIELLAIGPAKNPKIYNVDTREAFGLTVEVQEGDKITINTNPGQKSVTLLSNGTETNIINAIERGSSWFKLRAGDNVFTYIADELAENLICYFKHVDKYEGV